jgi:hypothetical protein
MLAIVDAMSRTFIDPPREQARTLNKNNVGVKSKLWDL